MVEILKGPVERGLALKAAVLQDLRNGGLAVGKESRSVFQTHRVDVVVKVLMKGLGKNP